MDRAINTKNIGLVSGPLSFILVINFFHPEGLTLEANAILASTVWMAIWWITEAIPISVTALLPIILFPLSGGLELSETTASFGHKYVFLYLGGFIIAIAMQKWNLHKRIALNIISFIGTDVIKIILGFMVATAFLSMWISNTATAVMMLPIAMAIVDQLKDNPNTIENENKVFTSGAGGIFKPGIPIGEIDKKQSNLDINVSFFSDFSQLRFMKLRSFSSEEN